MDVDVADEEEHQTEGQEEEEQAQLEVLEPQWALHEVVKTVLQVQYTL